MRRAVVFVCVALCSAVALAETSLRKVTWDKATVKGAEVVSPDEKASYARLRIQNPEGKATVAILTVADPGIKLATFAIRGNVRCEDVEGEGYLEMWTVFPDGKRYFSRTLGSWGTMEALGGTSGWRPFVLPFHIRKTTARPSKLVVNVVLPGRGTVEVGPVELAEFAPGEDPVAMPGQWWGDGQGGLLGGGFGILMGLFGAVVGTLGGRGKARRFVLAALKVLFAAGLVCLVVLAVALIDGQPFPVFFPLLIAGLLCTVLPARMIPMMRKRYEDLELRKIAARDA